MAEYMTVEDFMQEARNTTPEQLMERNKKFQRATKTWVKDQKSTLNRNLGNFLGAFKSLVRGKESVCRKASAVMAKAATQGYNRTYGQNAPTMESYNPLDDEIFMD